MIESFSETPFIGTLLVASSLVDDPIYSQGVCLIVHQDAEQVIGVMLNRPLKPSPEALMAMLGKGGAPKSLPSTSRLPSAENESAGNESASHDSEDHAAVGQDAPSGATDDDAGARDGDPETGMIHPLSLKNLGKIHFGGPLSGPVVALHRDANFAESEPGTGIYLAAQKQHLENLLSQSSPDCRLIVGHLRWDVDQFAAEIEAGYWHLVPATAETVFASSDDMWRGVIRRGTAHSVAGWIGTADVIGAAELN
ncbi:hypothetical protein K227x_08220 [Rubripirellula lacrimiformis]|uniref:Transcriptional regulator n=1 Tax=Rubripirellula lacrimiformis TaxID=1930273 RepID=A0A517N5N9_9BACT|nr:YqgE/AlgH family protein [Rubripirellula lacrimiformis]QDT02445.1 hypothetical protein K227x_08220 [Rubripirellula lacrimiformis]